jgi:hypothetical protein
MHEFENRPTRGISDCPGCARQRGVAGRTRDDHPTTMVHGQVMVGWWWSSQVSRRPSAGFCVDPWGYPLARAMRLMWSGRWLKAAATRRHSLCRCPARCARNAGKGMTGGRGWDGGEGRGGLACGLGPGVGDLACARYWGNVRVGGVSAFDVDPPDDRTATPRRRPPASSAHAQRGRPSARPRGGRPLGADAAIVDGACPPLKPPIFLRRNGNGMRTTVERILGSRQRRPHGW